jgi:hypothetical protein
MRFVEFQWNNTLRKEMEYAIRRKDIYMLVRRIIHFLHHWMGEYVKEQSVAHSYLGPDFQRIARDRWKYNRIQCRNHLRYIIFGIQYRALSTSTFTTITGTRLNVL